MHLGFCLTPLISEGLDTAQDTMEFAMLNIISTLFKKKDDYT